MRKALRAWVAALALLLLPVMAQAVGIGKPGDLAAGADLSGTEVYFGSYNGSSIKWYVVATDNAAGTATLWTTTSMGSRQYDPQQHRNWSGSDIAHWLNGTGTHNGNGFLQNAFSLAEQSAIMQYGTTENGLYVSNIDISQKIVLPSVAEIGAGGTTGDWGIPYTGTNDGKRGFGDWWWLRSPGDHGLFAAVASDVGIVFGSGYDVDLLASSRPAFKLNLASVIFTSSVSTNPKSDATAGAGLNPAAAIEAAGAVKLTITSVYHATTNPDGLALTSVTRTGISGRTVSFSYTGATVGKTLSAVVMDNTGAVTYYGKLAENIAASGSASVTIPSGLAATDTLHIFVEELNGDQETDFASALLPLGIPGDLDGSVSISGAVAVGETLTATPTITSAAPGALSYQWRRGGVDISGASSNTYTVTADDIGQTITVTVEAANCFGSLTSGGVMVLSNNAGLVNIFGQVLTLGNEAGTVGAPITANMAVANNVASIADSNISAATGATVELFSDAAFTTPQSPINLTAGASTTVYIRVTAADGVTTLYYAVTIARAANPLAGGTTASIPALGPMGLGLLVLMLAGVVMRRRKV